MTHASEQEDLHSGTPIWRLIGDPPLAYLPLERDLDCEVAIIGGGITGALAAERLTTAGLNVVLLDAGTFAAGSTIASTGLLDYELDLPLTELISRFGESVAVRAYRCGQEAIDQLEQMVTRLQIRCEFARRPTLKLASVAEDLPALRAEAECRRHFGFETQFFESHSLAEFAGITAAGALWAPGNAELDPYRFTQGLLKRFTEQGGRAFSNTTVLSLTEDSNCVRLNTDRNAAVVARSVIVATGYTSGKFGLPDPGVLRTTYAVASQPRMHVSRWPQSCLFWETAHPYFYARRTADGRVIIGGEDTSSPGDHENRALLREKVQRLLTRFTQLFGESFHPAAAWAGVFGESRDGLPFIGNPPGSERVYFALGYGGNGITFGKTAAEILGDLILGRPNPDASIFGFKR